LPLDIKMFTSNETIRVHNTLTRDNTRQISQRGNCDKDVIKDQSLKGFNLSL